MQRIAFSARIKNHGAAMVEFAITLPVFILLIFSLIEFSWAFYIKNVLIDVARQGAKLASTQYASDATLKSEINTLFLNYALSSHASVTNSKNQNIKCVPPTITLTPANASQQPQGTSLTVSISLLYACYALITPLYLGNTVLHQQVTMSKEY